MNQTIYLASDYDGTFKQGSIRGEDKEAIRRFRSRGGRFGLVTGRSLSMLEQEFARYDMQMDFIIACTGAVIFDQDLNVIFKKPMDTATAWELETEMERRPAGLCGMALAASRDHNPEGLPQYPREAVEQDGDIISMFLRGFDAEDSQALYNYLTAAYKDRLDFHYNGGAIDVTAPGVSKTEGVRAFKRLHPDSRVCVIGDEMNDLDMIRAFQGFSVTTGNEAVKQAASRVFDHISDCIDYLIRE